MPKNSTDLTVFKQQAAEAAVEFIQPGMIIGLGEGSTARIALHRIADLIQSGKLPDVLGVPASEHIGQQAEALGVPLTTLAQHPTVDVTIDGADEVDPQLNLIKGGGGALLREKILAQASRREIIIVDASKLSPALGTTWALPVEVIPFMWEAHLPFLRDLGGDPILRRNADGSPYHTDQANLILDVNFGPIADAAALAEALSHRAGIVEHGLFIDLATDVIVAGADGVRHLRREG